jgi:subtilase family serine protease
LLSLLSLPALATVPTTPAAVPLITQTIDDTRLAPVRGEVSGFVSVSKDLGIVNDSLALPHLQLLLKRPAARQAALDTLVSEQLKHGNPSFHKWVRPEELFAAFGPARADIDKVTAWLTQHGFTVNRVTADGMVVDFFGTARQAENLFHTEIHNFSLHGATHIANIREPAIPAALTGVVTGISLHNFFPRPAMRDFGTAKHDSDGWKMVAPGPNFITPVTPYGTFQAIGPNDFTKIYNVDPVRNGSFLGVSLTGKGATVAVIDDSSMHTKDWTKFRAVFGLSTYSGTLTLQQPGNCENPGYNGAESEADLDAEYASTSAPDAAVIQASCIDTSTTFGGYTALENMVSLGTPAQIISISYLECEAGNGPSAQQAWNLATEEGAAEGISIFVAAGDNGSDSCDNFDVDSYGISGLAVNGLASPPYVTAVGGTDFYDTALGVEDKYFAKKNGPGLETALSYVPEITWNENCTSPVLIAYEYAHGKTKVNTPVAFCNSKDGANDLNIVGGSGGRSEVYAKPDWQSLSVYGMPNDGARDLPDVSLFASSGFWGHFYVYCGSDAATGGKPCDYGNGTDVIYNAAGGTSFSSPAFAGIMVLETQYQALVQNAAGPVRIGNVAPELYQIAAAQFGSGTGLKRCNSTLGNKISSACVFNNVTANSNDVPCLAGTPNCYAKLKVQQLGVLTEKPGPSEVEAYYSRPGYSLGTGLGSVNVLNLIAAYDFPY